MWISEELSVEIVARDEHRVTFKREPPGRLTVASTKYKQNPQILLRHFLILNNES
jgi:hypothetical protein